MTGETEHRRQSITPRIRRLLDARDEIMGDAAEDVAFLHAVLAQTVLPYRAPDNATNVSRKARWRLRPTKGEAK